MKTIETKSASAEQAKKYFVSKPACSCFEVSALPKGALVEIEAIAVVE